MLCPLSCPYPVIEMGWNWNIIGWRAELSDVHALLQTICSDSLCIVFSSLGIWLQWTGATPDMPWKEGCFPNSCFPNHSRRNIWQSTARTLSLQPITLTPGFAPRKTHLANCRIHATLFINGQMEVHGSAIWIPMIGRNDRKDRVSFENGRHLMNIWVWLSLAMLIT